MNKESYFRDKISKIESAIEGLKLCYEWFSYEDITSKINHLESEANKLKSFIGESTREEDEKDEYIELYEL
mgnify:CR=1 FL=1